MKKITNVGEFYSMRRFTGWKLAVFNLKMYDFRLNAYKF